MMNRRSRLGLRSQLIIAMMICIVATVAISIAATVYFIERQRIDYEQRLSPRARKAQAEIDASRIPTDLAAVREIFDADKRATDESEYLGNLALLTVAFVSILVGSLIAIVLAIRIGRPLQSVSAAAQRVASGDLTARADPAVGGAGETVDLIENFNAMAASLAAFERQSVENSAAIAHELRTPLTILRGRLQGMVEGVFKTERRDLEGLIAQVESLTQIVNDLNIVGLAQAGRLHINVAPIDLAQEMAALLYMVEPDLATAQMAVEVALAPAAAHADANRVRQAALALIDNARSHAQSGGVVRVETAVVGDYAIIRVLDRGPGLVAEAAARVFEPFWRGDASRSRTSGGSGLGLSVVSSIAKAHRGSVRAEPREGGGAVFEILLPRAG
jgi:two-component system, OmpR family, sensor histidine kinase AdeS